MPKPNAGESKADFVARYVSSEEARKDFPDENQRLAVAYSTFGERRNAVALCSECGAEATEANGRLTCPMCGLIDRNPTPAVETIPNMCRNPQCGHPMTGEHDAIGCHVPGCLCTETRQAIEAPEDALNNGIAKCNECGQPMTADGNGGWTGHAAGCSTGEKTNASYPSRDAYSAHQDMCPPCMGASTRAECCPSGAKLFDAVRTEMRAEDVATMKRKNERSNAARAAFEAHAAECAGCTNAYDSGQPEAMCAAGVDLMNAGADKKAVLDEIKKIEQEIAALRAGPKSTATDLTLKVKETTLAGMRRELANEDKFAKGGDEFGKPGGTVTLVNGVPV